MNPFKRLKELDELLKKISKKNVVEVRNIQEEIKRLNRIISVNQGITIVS